MWISESVRAVQVPTNSAMQLNKTTIYLIGRGQVTTVDSGLDEEKFRWMLRGYLAGQEKAEIGLSLVTHFHADHSGNLRWLHDQFGSEVMALREGAPLFEDRLPDSGVTFFDAGDEITTGSGVRIQVIPTPGHTPDSVCFYIEEEGVLFTGDTVLGGANTLTSDLGAYLDSLRRIRELPNLKLIAAGHGELVTDPIGTIDATLNHYVEFESRVLGLLKPGEAVSSYEVAQRMYAGRDRGTIAMGEMKIRTQLIKLRNEGRLTGTSGVKRPVVEESEEERQKREEAIREAEQRLRELQRAGRNVRGNMTESEWLEPPTFSLRD